jgi:hypothetical protein
MVAERRAQKTATSQPAPVFTTRQVLVKVAAVVVYLAAGGNGDTGRGVGFLALWDSALSEYGNMKSRVDETHQKFTTGGIASVEKH